MKPSLTSPQHRKVQDPFSETIDILKIKKKEIAKMIKRAKLRTSWHKPETWNT